MRKRSTHITQRSPKLRETLGSFTIQKLRLTAGINKNIHDETVRRFMRSKGYRYYHSRKKGLLTKLDLLKRVKFCRHLIRTTNINFWQKDIAFYLNGVGFQHKYNPLDEANSCKTMAWRRKDEGLDPFCTAKGSHVGSGGRVAHFMVAISYDSGVVLCQQYEGRINGGMFAKFIRKTFENAFRKCSYQNTRLFLQDGDPSQNSQKACTAMKQVNATPFVIPARSPDLNPIENVFNYVKDKLHQQAIQENITFEDFDDFSERAEIMLMNTPISYINKTIDTMPKRLSMIVKAGGKRIRY